MNSNAVDPGLSWLRNSFLNKLLLLLKKKKLIKELIKQKITPRLLQVLIRGSWSLCSGSGFQTGSCCKWAL